MDQPQSGPERTTGGGLGLRGMGGGGGVNLYVSLGYLENRISIEEVSVELQ